jgi:ACT domain-containing protein
MSPRCGISAGRQFTLTVDMDYKTTESKKWEKLGIQRSTFYKYKKLGLPDDMEEAKEWIRSRVGLTDKGGNSVIVDGKSFTGKDLIDLKGRLLSQQVENLELRNQIERHRLREREKTLVKADEAMEVIHQILKPLRASFDQLPDNLGSVLNPSDPARASSILETEINNIYVDLTKTLSKVK